MNGFEWDLTSVLPKYLPVFYWDFCIMAIPLNWDPIVGSQFWGSRYVYICIYIYISIGCPESLKTLICERLVLCTVFFDSSMLKVKTQRFPNCHPASVVSSLSFFVFFCLVNTPRSLHNSFLKKKKSINNNYNNSNNNPPNSCINGYLRETTKTRKTNKMIPPENKQKQAYKTGFASKKRGVWPGHRLPR